MTRFALQGNGLARSFPGVRKATEWSLLTEIFISNSFIAIAWSVVCVVFVHQLVFVFCHVLYGKHLGLNVVIKGACRLCTGATREVKRCSRCAAQD